MNIKLMIDIDKDGLVQRTMAGLCNVSPTTISRYITSNHLTPLDKSVSKNQRFSIEASREIVRNVSDFFLSRSVKEKICFL
ncbi:MAG: hypothetical protein NWS20_00950 [Rickettsiaceae bacterium]|nr:hypothetical protein [Rickettsiaceae bacterium]